MKIGICSYSFHRLLAAGKQDIFRFITDCKTLGCTQLDPWNGHLSELATGDKAIPAGVDPHQVGVLSQAERDYLAKVKAAGDQAAMPFGIVAVDGAHIYEADLDKRKANRARAYRWLEAAHRLGATQVRIDCGGPEDMPAEVFALIKEGYNDLIARAAAQRLEIIMENHWGPSVTPDHVVRIMEGIPGLGLLYDTHNWKPELRAEGRRRCAKYARAAHIKTFVWDADGNELGEDVPAAVALLKQANYQGCWGVESVPKDGDEIEGARKTIALIKRLAA